MSRQKGAVVRLPGRAESIDVSIGFPPFEISGTFTPTRAERLAAWELLVELTSRTSVTPLSDDHGSTTAALSSLYKLYDITRELLRKHGPDVGASRSDGNLSLGLVSLRVLNEILRPFLTEWHPLLDDHMERRPQDKAKNEWERKWGKHAECRTALNAVRRSVRAYIETLARIAGTPDIADAALAQPPAIAAPRSRPVKDLLPAGFEPRRHMVRWLSLLEGSQIGVTVLRTKKGPASGPVPDPPEPLEAKDMSQQEEIWFDYVADLGDAFDPTMAVAWQIGRRSLHLPADPTGELPTPPGALPRGSLLVMGGDQVYPTATKRRYERQLVIPYKAAFEDPGTEENLVVAIPGNHDWLGGITHFEGIFVAPDGSGIGEWRATQRQRWFNVQLPHGWWLWGLDVGLIDDLGPEQLDYFERAAAELRHGDRVILCTPVPLWQLRAKQAEEYYELRYRLSEWLGHKGATTPLCLSGDSHVFAVYETAGSVESELHVTSGGGGAFLHPTHMLTEQVPYERGRAEFELKARWPSPADSRAASRGVRLLRDRQSLTVLPVVIGLHALYSLCIERRWWSWGGADDPGDWIHSLGYAASSALALMILALLVVVGRATVAPNAREHLVAKGARRLGWLLGVTLAGLFWATTAAVHWAVDTWLGWSGPARMCAFALGSVLAGTLAYAVFLTAISRLNRRYRLNDNLAYAAGHSGRYKHFLRCHIDSNGDLTVYAIGIDPIGRDWHDALEQQRPVPPPDPDGTPFLHYLWGHKFAGPT